MTYLGEIKNIAPGIGITLPQYIACGGLGSEYTVVHKMGYNADIDGTTVEDMWTAGSTYAFPLVATYPGAKMEVVSTDNTNDKAGGTGALTVKIGYLTDAGVQKSEVVIMNGTTAVQTAGADIWRINSFRVASGAAAAGTITLQEIDNSPVFSHIAAGETRARNMAYTVPAGKALVIGSIQIGAAASTVDKAYLKFTLRGNLNEGAKTTVGLEYPLWEGQVQGGSFQCTLDNPIVVPAGVDLRMKVVGVAATDNAIGTCEWRGCLVPA